MTKTANGCWICTPFNTQDTCKSCESLTEYERQAKLTDTLVEEILIEEKNANIQTKLQK